MILELIEESHRRGTMVPAFVQHLANGRHQRDMRAQRRGEYFLAPVSVGFDELPAGMGQANVALFEFGKAQELQGFAERQQVVEFELQRGGNRWQVRATVVWRSGKEF